MKKEGECLTNNDPLGHYILIPAKSIDDTDSSVLILKSPYDSEITRWHVGGDLVGYREGSRGGMLLIGLEAPFMCRIQK